MMWGGETYSDSIRSLIPQVDRSCLIGDVLVDCVIDEFEDGFYICWPTELEE